ncbi:MAG: iron-sulfur cluster assembly scaffold protein [Candidatus Aenigmatarchaeota archaeon]
MELYSKEIMKHFKNPKNVGRIKNADGIGEAGNLVCGDVMKIYIKVSDKNGKKIIKDIKFETFGCVVAIANTSLLTTLVKGKTLEEALKIKKEDLVKKLGKVPPIKIHCSVLATDALKEAIYDYLKRNNLPIPEDLEKEHKRIVENREKLEKEYANFVNMEKEVLK